MALKEEINSLYRQIFQIISSSPYCLTQKDLNYFDEKIHQLEGQLSVIDEEIRYWRQKLEGIIMANKKLKYENNVVLEVNIPIFREPIIYEVPRYVTREVNAPTFRELIIHEEARYMARGVDIPIFREPSHKDEMTKEGFHKLLMVKKKNNPFSEKILKIHHKMVVKIYL